MTIRPAIITLVVASAFYVLPAAADDAATIAEIKAAVLKIDKAYADEDPATIKAMILPDQVSIAPRYGGAASPDAQIKAFEHLDRSHFDYSPIDVELLSPTVALATFEKSYSGTYKGTTLPPRVFVSEIWLKRDDGWRQRFYQETPIEKQ
jgi:ketosteroid isomerase-like protein